ncbi:hypothetical protein MAR_013937 [Mya arenaria]|uniref:Uncharacterized protein n=1 Tax=Mya arenaria TaxID=6604 RepID=A0ABY7G191_MYAAR|nr:hypothetical protein MAR_013937 [Mya arenaria]
MLVSIHTFQATKNLILPRGVPCCLSLFPQSTKEEDKSNGKRQSPFFTAFAEMFKSEHQQHKKKKALQQPMEAKSLNKFLLIGRISAARKIRTGGLVCVPDGTSDAHPDEPRSAVQPVPADEMPDGVDQPAGLPDPNYRSLEQ